jgi:hypothetical protein
MLNKKVLRAMSPISLDKLMLVLRIGVISALLLSSLLLTGAAFAEPIRGLCGG